MTKPDAEEDTSRTAPDAAGEERVRRPRRAARARSSSRADRTITIAGTAIAPGQRLELDIPVARLPTQTVVELPVIVVHGARPGPTVFLSAAIHGDEIHGLEIIWRVVDSLEPERLRGTILAAPIVNVIGFIQHSRYLPDRRDLNRSFPGSSRGSLASRLAHFFMSEIVEKCTHGIDLHAGSHHRSNLPQVRANLDDPETRRLAAAFGTSASIHAPLRDGSLRAAAGSKMPVLVFEGGEANRFDEGVIAAGVRGVVSVLRELRMVPGRARPHRELLEIRETSWVRARHGGILRLSVRLGERVAKDQRMGDVVDVFGSRQARLKAPFDGLVIGRTNNPLVHTGDAVVHLGRIPG